MSKRDNSNLTFETQKYLEVYPSNIDWSVITADIIRSVPITPYPTDIPKPEVDTENIQISDLLDGHPINIEVFRPKNAPADIPLPALIYLNGGGFAFPPQEGHQFMATKIAAEVNCAVFLVSYSLSPEAKFPVALEESYSVVSHLTNPETAKKVNVDPTRVAVGGDSSGGNLTAGVTILAKQRNELKNKIKYQVLIYPATDGSMATESFAEYAEGYNLSLGLTKLFLEWYTTDESKGNILFAPLHATLEELSGLPPAFVMSAEIDVLRSETEDYGRKLLKAGVPVTSVRMNGVLHGFLSVAELYSNDSLAALDMITGALRRAFA